MLVAGQIITVIQGPAPCVYEISPTELTHEFFGATNFFSLTTFEPCAWIVFNTNAWIAVLSETNGVGSTNIDYIVAENPFNAWRTGVVVVVDQLFTVIQQPRPCAYTLSATNAAHGPLSENGVFSVITSNDCPWVASSPDGWITFVPPTSGSGNGEVRYTVGANPAAVPRSGTILVAGQVFTVTQAAAPCPFTLTPPHQTFAAGAVTAAVNVMTLPDCQWAATTTNEWLTILSSVTNRGDGAVSYAVTENLFPTERIGFIFVEGQAHVVTQQATICVYAIAPTNTAHGFSSETGLVSVTTGVNCPWNVENTNAWILLTATNGVGSTNIDYIVAENPFNAWRTGVVAVVDQLFTVIQQPRPCAYTLSATNAAHGPLSENGVFSVMTSNDCPWGASSPDGWITFVPPTSGSGNAQVHYTVGANPAAVPRSGTILVASQVFTVTQAAAPCPFTLTPPHQTFAAGAVTAAVNVTTLPDCQWAATTTNEWLTILSSATNSGDGVVSYALAENLLLTERVGFIFVEGQAHVVTQQATVCLYAIAPTNTAHGFSSETGLVSVTTGVNCPWDVENTNSWILLTPTNGIGSTNIDYIVAENPFNAWRTGVVVVVDQLFTVIQQPRPCAYTLSATNAAHGPQSEQGVFSVATSNDCPWTASSPEGWITFVPPTSGSGNGQVRYTVGANPAAVPRSGTILVADQVFTVTQAAAPCPFTLTPPHQTFAAGAITAAVNVTTLADCQWAATTTNDWLTILSSATNSGDGVVSYAVTENLLLTERVGFIFVEGQAHVVTQQATICVYTIAPTNTAHGFGSETGLVSVTTGVNCPWNVENTNAWISVTATNGVGNGSFGYTIEANPTALERSGLLVVAGQPVLITQAGAECTFVLGAAGATHSASATTGSVMVTTLDGCEWNVSSGAPWLSILSTSINTNGGSVTYSVMENGTALLRTGVVSIAGQEFTVIQSGADCFFALATNGATHSAGLATNSVAVTTLLGCTWSVSNGTPWIEILSPLANTGATSVTYRVLANPDALWRTGIVTIAEQDLTVVQGPLDCSFALSTNAVTHGASEVTNSISVTTLVGCTWSVSNGAPWIHILSSLNNSNAGAVSYRLEANPTAIARSAVIRIAELDFTVTQAGRDCSFELDSFGVSHGSGVESGFVQVTTSPGCTWSVVNNNSWIIIHTPLENTNSGTVSYTVEVNPTAFLRVGLVKIAGEDFVIDQAAAVCSYALGTNSAQHSAAAATNSVTVFTFDGCPWVVENTNPWIVIQSPLTNTHQAVVTYHVLANTTAVARAGVVRIAQQDFIVSQLGADCTFVLGSNSAAFDFAAVTGAVSVTTLDGCTWPVSTGTSWITILSSLNNSNSGNVSFRVQNNPSSLSRTGLMSIAGQDFTVTQSGAPCSFVLSATNATHGPGSEANLINVTTLEACTWSVSNGTPWIVIESVLNNVPAGSVSYRVLTNTTALWRTGVVNVAGQNVTIAQAGAACSFTLSSNSLSLSAATATRTVSVTTVDGCTWSASAGVPWITVMTGANYTNSGDVTFIVAENPTALLRTGIVTIAGQSFEVTQGGAACTYGLGSGGIVVGSTSINSSVTVTTLVGCAWSVLNGTPWIQILSDLSSTNSGTVNFSVQSNSTALWRTGVVNIAGLDFTVAQAGAACSFLLASNSASHGPGAETNSVALTTLVGCNWNVSNGAPWISILSSLSSSNSGLVSYSIATNPTALLRTAVLNIGGQNFTVTQAGADCAYLLSSQSAAHGAGVEVNSVTVETLPGCVWNVSTGHPWITIQSPLNNTNNGTVTYSVLSNISVLSRTGLVMIAGQSFTVTQLPGLECSLSLQSTNWFHRTNAENGVIGVSSLPGCSWGVTNTNAWVTLLTGPRIEGTGHVLYAVAANTEFNPRSGFISVGNLAFALTQAGAGCVYRVSPTNRPHGNGPNSGTFNVTASAGCAWSVLNTNDWLSIVANASGVGNQTVTYSFTRNSNAAPRTGYLNVGGDAVLVSQWGTVCGFSTSPQVRNHGPGAESGTTLLNASSGTCNWTVTNNVPWINVTTTSGQGGGITISYNVLANTNGTPRQGIFTIGGAQMVINQAGVPCSFTVTPPPASHGPGIETGSLAVSTGNGCIWYIFNTNSWIAFNEWNGTNSGTATYTVQANPTIFHRSGVVVIGGQNVVVSQEGAPCTFTLVPAQGAHGSGVGNGSFDVLTLNGCDWVATSGNSWIVITAGANGQGNGTVTYSVTANPSVLSRTGTVSVADQTYSVVQAGIPCVFQLSASAASHGGEAENGSVTLSTDPLCQWTVENTNGWITIAAGGTGGGTIGYTVAANPVFSPRSGVIIIAGRSFTVTQAARPCVYVFSPAAATFRSAATNSSFSIIASNECSWTVVNSNAWITITSLTTNGNGNGAVTYSVATNSGMLRIGNIYVGGTPFRVMQAGAIRVVRVLGMTVQRGQTNRAHVVLESTGAENAMGVSLLFDTNQLEFVEALRGAGAAAVNSSFTVNTNLASTHGAVGIQLGLNIGTGVTFPPGSNIVADVHFRARPGTSFASTLVTFTNSPVFTEISDLTANALPATYVPATVNVLGTCNYALSTNATSVAAAGGSRSVTITTHALCPWTVSNSHPWITITAGGQGVGNGTVNFTVAGNPTGLVRAGTIYIGGIAFNVIQDGLPCAYSLAPGSRSHGADAEGGIVSVTAVPGCDWTVLNPNQWVTILSPVDGTGSGDVAYNVAPNPSSAPRTGVLTIAEQSFTITQAGSTCVFTISPTNRTHSSLSETGLVIVTAPGGCPWTVSNTNTWVFITSATNGFGSGSVGYLVTYNPNGQSRTGVVTIASRNYVVVQSANPCPVTLTPSGRDHGGDQTESNFFSVAASACAWTVNNTNGWIFIHSSTNGSGNGSVNYSVAPNPTLAARTGIIRVSGREFTVTQAAATCLYGLSPTGEFHGAGVEPGVVTLATFGTCNWTLVNTNPWIIINSPTSGMASANIQYTVTNNPSSLFRTGLVQIAGQTFSIIQTGAPCTLVLSNPAPTHGFAAFTNAVPVTTPQACRWTVSNTNTWITFFGTGNYTNSGGVSYWVASNATAVTRVGLVTVGDQVLTITQTGVPCTISIAPTNRPHHYGLVTNTLAVTTPTGCPWFVDNTNSWVTILSGASGLSNGVVTYVLDANPLPLARTGIVTIAERTITLTQTAAPCAYALSPSNVVRSAGEELFEVELITSLGCPWTIVNTNTWIDYLSGAGIGGATLQLVVYENPTGAWRTGYVTVANQVLMVRQAGQPCSYTVSETSRLHAPDAETSTVFVGALVGCPWTIGNTNNWISIQGSTNRAGSGTVAYSIAANPFSIDRTGIVWVAGQAVSVTQLGITCNYSLSSSNITLGSGNVTGLVSVTSSGNCTWQVVETNSWISIKSGAAGTNNGLVRFTVEANQFPSTRSGTMTVAGIPYTVTQLGSPCSYTLSAAGRFHGSGYETGQVSILTVSECGWTIDNTNDWIEFTSPQSGLGTALIGYSVQPNPGSVDRIGTFLVGDQPYTVTQFGAACSYTTLTNGANHGALMETGTVHFVVPVGCAYTVAKSNTWLNILSTVATSNRVVVTYNVTVNVSGAQRISQITLGSTTDRAVFTVTQATVVCSFIVSPTTRNHGFEAESGFISVTTSNPCPWTVSETNTWITLSNGTNYTGTTPVNYSITANPSSLSRTGTLIVAGQQVRIIQAGLTCSYSIDPSGLSHGFLVSTGSISVTSPTLCTWNISKTNSWITMLTPTNFTGPVTARYWLQQNPSALSRTSVITIATRPFTVIQSGAPFLIASNKTLNCDVAWTFDVPVNAGNCGTPGQTISVVNTATNYGCGPTYVATRIWAATNACGDGVLATQTVSVVSPPPLMLCSPNKTVECNSIWSFDPPLTQEYCGGTNITLRSTTVVVTNGMCGSSYVATRTWEATDSCSNKSTCSQSVFVVDTTPPVVIPTGADKWEQCGTPWNFDPPTGVDGCHGTNVIVRVLSTSTNFGCGYVATRVWEIVDPCGNQALFSQSVFAADTLPPDMTCAPTKTVECGTAWNFDQPSATDLCSAPNSVVITVLDTVTNSVGQCGRTFTATRTWMAGDACGNVNFCSQTVRVVDTTRPSVLPAPNKTIELGNAWDFDPPTGSDGCGGTNVFVTVVSTTTNAGPCGAAYVAMRVWEVADACNNRSNCTQMVTVRDTTPPVFAALPDKNINCLGPWTFDPPVAVDIGSGTNLAFTVIGAITNGTCGGNYSVTITWRATDGCGNSSIQSQTAFGRAVVTVSGTVFCPTNYPATLSDKRIPGAVLLGPTNASATSVSDGTYNLQFDAATNVVVKAFAPAIAEPSLGVTTLDIQIARRHVLDVARLDTPYKRLCGDVDESGDISTLDLSHMRRLVLTSTNRLPAGLWKLIPADYVFPDPERPWGAPTNRHYPALNFNVTGQDFVALKLGDVDGSMSLSNPKSARAAVKSGPAVTFGIEGTTNVSGTSVVLRVTVAGFNQIGTAQGTLSWDSSVVRFTRVEQIGLPGLGGANFGTNRLAEGKLTFSWDDLQGRGTTLPDGAVVFALRFDLIGSPGSYSPVTFSDAAARCEVTMNLEPLTFQFTSGHVLVAGAAPAPVMPRLTEAAFGPGSFQMAVPTAIGRTYTLEYTDSLSVPNWVALPPLTGNGAVQIFSDPSPHAQQRFYRLKIE